MSQSSKPLRQSNKLSKSELSTPEFAERARLAAEEIAAKQLVQSNCWANGAYVWQAGSRGFIVCRSKDSAGTALRIWWDDGRVTTVRPHALNR